MGLATEKLPHLKNQPEVDRRITSEVEGHLATRQCDMVPQPGLDFGLRTRRSMSNALIVMGQPSAAVHTVLVLCCVLLRSTHSPVHEPSDLETLLASPQSRRISTGWLAHKQ